MKNDFITIKIPDLSLPSERLYLAIHYNVILPCINLECSRDIISKLYAFNYFVKQKMMNETEWEKLSEYLQAVAENPFAI